MPPRHIPRLIDAQLYPAQGEPPSFAPIDVESVESDEWFEWLKHPLHSSFSYQTLTATLTVRREQKRNGWYWYAYRSYEGKLHKVYLGKAEDISLDRLSRAAATLTGRDEPSERASRLRMTFFGPPQILHVSALAPLSVTKAVALLAYLSAHERPQRRDHLLSLFWPESSSAQARKNLRNVLWTIRLVLGPDALSGEATLTLHDQVWIDVRDFEQLHRDAMRLEVEGHLALEHYQKRSALYQGSFLDGIALSDSAEFDT